MGETPRAPITTILFTDLVDSTARMQRVGDERSQRLFETHHQLLSDAVSAHGGSELQWLGDGLIVASASAGPGHDERIRNGPPTARPKRSLIL